MQSETGCKINVSQASGADIEREIGLVGTRQAIDDAKRAIWEKVDQVVGLCGPRLVNIC
jgi:far upstream element-binding protein